MSDRSTEKRLRILSAITRVHHSIGAETELEDFSRTVVEELVTIVNCTGCAILMIEESKVRILAERAFSKTHREMTFKTYMPAIKHVANTKTSIYTNDIANHPAADYVPAGRQMNSIICTPVVVKGEVKGIIHLDSPHTDAFDEEDLHFVELLAEGISIAIERHFLHSQVEALSIRDDLTKCFNRKKLEEDLDAEIARAKRYERPLSLLMVDVDWFKKYNDFHGNSKGDELLKKLVEMFIDKVRTIDKVYRYSGEEFVILLPETERENALLVASRLQKMVEQEQFEGEAESQPNKKVTVSIGVVNYPWDGNDKEEILKSANAALDRAKQSGRNCVFDLVGANSSTS